MSDGKNLDARMEMLQAFAVETPLDDPELLFAGVIEKIKMLQYKAGLPSDFSHYKISEGDLQRTVVAVSSDPAALNFPIPPELIRSIGEKIVRLEVKN
ncbi:dehydroquinate synthase/iron-containing alcohol dehydrogenase family protein [Litchfieldia alkalitelluris]|uniref:hypothetical protein n=1 Tax=Litchfieldia alkalitelluris TaxID=304268 RepID=UPI00195C0FB2|nr:hypothetical protein [Litchfieldia alkalitelluris]